MPARKYTEQSLYIVTVDNGHRSNIEFIGLNLNGIDIERIVYHFRQEYKEYKKFEYDENESGYDDYVIYVSLFYLTDGCLNRTLQIDQFYNKETYFMKKSEDNIFKGNCKEFEMFLDKRGISMDY